jgi:hypothetical protein
MADQCGASTPLALLGPPAGAPAWLGPQAQWAAASTPRDADSGDTGASPPSHGSGGCAPWPGDRAHDPQCEGSAHGSSAGRCRTRPEGDFSQQ